jgi:hypothetical protein
MATMELNRGFDHKLARIIGIDKAVMISQISYWTDKNTNIRDGYSWVYNTAKDWQIQFDWLTVKTVQRYLKSLVDMGLLIAENFNKMRIDRTKWYRVDYDKLAELLGESESTEEGTTSPNHDNYQFQSKGTDSPNGKELSIPTNNQRLPENNSKINTIYQFNKNKSQSSGQPSTTNKVNQSVNRETVQPQQPTKSNKRYYEQFRKNQTAKSRYYAPIKKHIEKATDWSKKQAEKVDVDVNAMQKFFADFENSIFSGQLQA